MLQAVSTSRSLHLYCRQFDYTAAISTMRFAFCLGLFFLSNCTASSRQLPEECTPPASLEQANGSKPSAQLAGAWFMKHGNLSCAVSAYQEGVRMEPQSAQAHYDLGTALFATQQLATAGEEFRLAVHYKPDMKMAHSSLGAVLMDLGKTANAEAEFREALRLDPKLAPAQVGLGMICANKGDLEGSEKLLRQAIANDPNYGPAHVNLGLVLARRQKFGPAEAEVDLAVKLAPQDPASLAAAGRVKARMGKNPEGVALLRRAVALAPQSPVMHLGLGMVLAESYDLTGALAENNEALRLAPESAQAHLNRGRVLLDLGRNAEAKPDLESTIRRAPHMPEPYYFLALIEKQAGSYKRAVELLQTAVTLQPANATAWNLLGQCLDRESQTKEAIGAWRHAVAADSENTQALFSLARSLKPTDPDEAARFLARYTEVQNKHRIVDEASTLGNNALAAGAAHDWPEAIRQFQKAIDVCGDCAIKADLHKKLGLTDCQMGDLDNGEKELRLAQALKPDDPDIERALRRIAAVRRPLI